jgi:hypothetical protein
VVTVYFLCGDGWCFVLDGQCVWEGGYNTADDAMRAGKRLWYYREAFGEMSLARRNARWGEVLQ